MSELDLISRLKDADAMMKVAFCISVRGEGFNSVVLPEGTFIDPPQEILGLRVIESRYVERGKAIFVNS